MRKILTPSFNFHNLKIFYKIFIEQSEILQNRINDLISESKTINIMPLIQDFGLDCVVGNSINNHGPVEYRIMKLLREIPDQLIPLSI